MAQAAVQRLASDGIRVTGVILNGWDPSRGGPYGQSTLGGSSLKTYDKSARKEWKPML